PTGGPRAVTGTRSPPSGGAAPRRCASNWPPPSNGGPANSAWKRAHYGIHPPPGPPPPGPTLALGAGPGSPGGKLPRAVPRPRGEPRRPRRPQLQRDGAPRGGGRAAAAGGIPPALWPLRAPTPAAFRGPRTPGERSRGRNHFLLGPPPRRPRRAAGVR